MSISNSETVVILCPGPSLCKEQVDLLRTADPFKQTIVVGDAWRLYPEADTLYHCDAAWWNYYAGVPEFRGQKISLEATKFTLQLRQSSLREGLDLTYPNVVTGSNSGYQAINLAVHRKPRKIILLGYDMKDSADGRHNVIGDHPPEIKRGFPAEKYRKKMELLVKPLEELGIVVYNCSLDTALNCFLKRTLTDVV